MDQANREAVERVRQRLKDLWKNWRPDSPEFKRAFHTIGQKLTTDTKMAITNLRIVNTGRLRLSVGYMPEASGIEFGVFGVPYARHHEYGSNWTDANRRAMWYYFRKTRGAKAKPPASKGVVRGGRLTPRPFLNPSVAKNREFIIDTLRMLGRANGK